MTLAQMARRYAQSELRQNPEPTVDEVVDGFCVEIKKDGGRLSKWSETDWLDALGELGVGDGDLASTMESVASWGVDD
jgi:hypothetical protein